MKVLMGLLIGALGMVVFIVLTASLIIAWGVTHPETTDLAVRCLYQPPSTAVACKALGQKVQEDMAAFVNRRTD